jgi:hypothetical protein
MFRALGNCPLASLTSAPGTPILAHVPPHRKGYSLLTKVLYRAAGTAHSVTVMKELDRTTLSAATAGGASVINLTDDPGTGTVAGAIAADDYVVVELDSGGAFACKVASVSSLAVTLSEVLPSAAAGGRTVWFLGAPEDHASEQQTGQQTTGLSFDAPASELTDRGDAAAGLCSSPSIWSPLLVHSDNVAAAGQFEQVTAVYTLTGP